MIFCYEGLCNLGELLFQTAEHFLHDTSMYVRIERTYTRKIYSRRQRKPRKKQQQEGSRYIDSQNIIRGIDLGKRAANTEVGRMIVDDVVGLIPRGYKALKNKLFKHKTTTTTPFYSHQPVQKHFSEGYQPVQILSPEYY